MSRQELDTILGKAESVLDAEEFRKLSSLVSTLEYLTAELGKKNTSVRRLRAMLFGQQNEKTSALRSRLKKMLANAESGVAESLDASEGTPEASQDGAEAKGTSSQASQTPKKKTQGHGRNKASSYSGGEQQHVAHPDLAHKASCPNCPTGRVYLQKVPKVVVRLTGQAPVQAKVWSYDWLRCNLCDTQFNAPLPQEVGEADKYDESVTSMIGLLRYGYGMPMNRLASLQSNLNIPLPVSTQWQLLDRGSGHLEVVFQALMRQAAEGEVIYNDDTIARILDVMAENRKIPPDNKGGKQRTGTFTTGLVSTLKSSHQVALFLTGRQHAGENLSDVLAECEPAERTIIQMSDGLSRNSPESLPEGLQIIEANCLAHGRRKYVEIADSFPEYCLHVIEQLSVVYSNDATARRDKMSAEARLEYHQTHSATVMADLKTWLEGLLKEKLVEPNGGFGDATKYMLKRWDKLTCFLNTAGAPLDNNICERALKKAIRQRKNSLFYKTLHGARVGDIYMSLIHTCELCGANPIDYLTMLLRHHNMVADSPDEWMPWNYQDALATVDALRSQGQDAA